MGTTTPTRGFLTPAAVATMLGFSKVDSIYRLIALGQLEANNVAPDPDGRPLWRIPPDAVGRFLEARRARPISASQPRRRRTRPHPTRYF